MRRLAIRECGEEIMITSGLGSTETAPSAMFANWHSDVSGNIGIPLPGVDVKLVPVGSRLEVRFRGPSITPGYLHRDDLTEASFDEDGYYKMGDALRPVDPNDFSRGFLFGGRIGEDFKLGTGTWVNVGPLRIALMGALAPLVRDVVICGADREFLTILMLPDWAAVRTLAAVPSGATDAAALASPTVRAEIADRLEAFAEAHPGSSTHPNRAIFLETPPSIDAGEITDKGSLNNAIIRERRADLIEHLYAPEHPLVIAIA
jgi:feruloyl-CoA synthase